MDEKLKKLCFLTICLITTVFLLGVFITSLTREKDELPENCEVEIVLSNYFAENNDIIFETQIYCKNFSSEDKYYKFSGDFRTEYYVKMIDERTLTGYNKGTDFDTFFVPSQTEGIFEVAFSSKGDDSVKKPDRLGPRLIVKDIEKDKVDQNKVVRNKVYLGLNDNGDVFLGDQSGDRDQSARQSGDGSRGNQGTVL